MAEPTTTRRKTGLKIYRLIATACILGLVILGYSRRFLPREALIGASLSPLKVLYGTILCLWLGYYFLQVWFAASDRLELHRRIGMYGFSLAAALVIAGVALAALAARSRGCDAASLESMAAPVADMGVFGGLTFAGYLYRNRGGFHKRYLQLAILSILPPALARLPFAADPLVYFGMTDAIILGYIGVDIFRKKRLHPAFIWGFSALLVSEPGRFLIAHTQSWRSFATWLARL